MKTLFILLLSLLSFSSFSQDSIELAFPKHYIGLHAGTTTGIGFSYRFWPKKLGIQATSVPIFTKDGYLISFGLSGLYTLKTGKYVNLYSYVGNHLALTQTTQYYYDPILQKDTETIINSTSYNIGAGIGYQIKFLKVLDFNLQGGLGFFEINKITSLGPAGEIGLYYHF